MPALARRRALFLSTFTLTALLLALPVVPALAATSGIDTPTGVLDLPLAVQGVEVMDLTSTGNVGIGMTGPLAKLQVSGGNGWSSSNFGAALVAQTPGKNSAIGLLDFAGANPWAIADVNGAVAGTLTFAAMPALGNTSSPPTTVMSLTPAGNVGIQTANPGEPLDINGIARSNAQFISTAGGPEFRGIAGNYGWMDYSDGANFYFLLTNAGNQYGTYNSLRPYNINLATGAMSISNSLTVTGGLTADNATIGNNETVGGTVTVNGSTITNATINVANALLTPTCGSNEALTENTNHTFACVTIANLAQIGPATVPNCAGMVPPEALTWNGTGFSCVASGSATPPPLCGRHCLAISITRAWQVMLGSTPQLRKPRSMLTDLSIQVCKQSERAALHLWERWGMMLMVM